MMMSLRHHRYTLISLVLSLSACCDVPDHQAYTPGQSFKAHVHSSTASLSCHQHHCVTNYLATTFQQLLPLEWVSMLPFIASCCCIASLASVRGNCDDVKLMFAVQVNEARQILIDALSDIWPDDDYDSCFARTAAMICLRNEFTIGRAYAYELSAAPSSNIHTHLHKNGLATPNVRLLSVLALPQTKPYFKTIPQAGKTPSDVLLLLPQLFSGHPSSLVRGIVQQTFLNVPGGVRMQDVTFKARSSSSKARSSPYKAKPSPSKTMPSPAKFKPSPSRPRPFPVNAMPSPPTGNHVQPAASKHGSEANCSQDDSEGFPAALASFKHLFAETQMQPEALLPVSYPATCCLQPCCVPCYSQNAVGHDTMEHTACLSVCPSICLIASLELLSNGPVLL